MLGTLPFLLVVFGTPLAVLTIIPASVVWNRLSHGRGTALSVLYLTQADAAALEPRLASAFRRGVLSLGIAAVGFGVLLGAAFVGVDDRWIAAAGPLIAAVAALALVDRPGGDTRRLDEPGLRAERLGTWAVLGLAGLLVIGVLAAGVVSVPDTPTDHFRAYPRASLIDWFYSFDGIPKDFEYTAHGVTVPWPGWYYGGPVLGAVALALAGFYLVSRWGAPGLEPSAPADRARFLRWTIAGALTAAGLCASLTFVATMAGDVLTSVSVFAKPQPPNAGVLKPVGHSEPEYVLGSLALYSWVLLVPLALALVWVAVFAVRDLRAGLLAARMLIAREGA